MVARYYLSTRMRVAQPKMLRAKMHHPKKLAVIITDPKIIHPKITRPKYGLDSGTVNYSRARNLSYTKPDQNQNIVKYSANIEWTKGYSSVLDE